MPQTSPSPSYIPRQRSSPSNKRKSSSFNDTHTKENKENARKRSKSTAAEHAAFSRYLPFTLSHDKQLGAIWEKEKRFPSDGSLAAWAEARQLHPDTAGAWFRRQRNIALRSGEQLPAEHETYELKIGRPPKRMIDIQDFHIPPPPRPVFIDIQLPSSSPNHHRKPQPSIKCIQASPAKVAIKSEEPEDLTPVESSPRCIVSTEVSVSEDEDLSPVRNSCALFEMGEPLGFEALPSTSLIDIPIELYTGGEWSHLSPFPLVQEWSIWPNDSNIPQNRPKDYLSDYSGYNVSNVSFQDRRREFLPTSDCSGSSLMFNDNKLAKHCYSPSYSHSPSFNLSQNDYTVPPTFNSTNIVPSKGNPGSYVYTNRRTSEMPPTGPKNFQSSLIRSTYRGVIPPSPLPLLVGPKAPASPFECSVVPFQKPMSTPKPVIGPLKNSPINCPPYLGMIPPSPSPFIFGRNPPRSPFEYSIGPSQMPIATPKPAIGPINCSPYRRGIIPPSPAPSRVGPMTPTTIISVPFSVPRTPSACFRG